MFQYEYEKRPSSASSSGSRATASTSWSRSEPCSMARRPLPPRPIACERMPAKTTVPLKVWIIASASCFAVCAALVLATVVITKWGSGPYTSQVYQEPEQIYSIQHPIYIPPPPLEPESTTSINDINSDRDLEILEKLSIFKNIVANREKNKKAEDSNRKDKKTELEPSRDIKKTEDLISKPQLHPLHDTSIEHLERKIEKKANPKYPEHIEATKFNIDDVKNSIPEFKPTLPDVFVNHAEINLPDGYMIGLRKHDSYEEYYNDDNLYDDYMQSNTMTNYLIEKVQELHDWITNDPDFEAVKNSSRIARTTDFSQVLKALNESLVRGNVSIIMTKLRDIYYGDNYTASNHSRRMIVTNSTDLLSFGILTLDIMLLHNIQLMAWESQESTRIKMLRDPDVFAFNALFMEPGKVEAKQHEVNHHHENSAFGKRQNLRQDVDEFDIGKSLLENFLEVGMSTARAAIHLGRAYKNTKAILAQLSNRESAQSQLRNVDLDGNSQALQRLQSFGQGPVTELDCLWLLYCRNLAATSRLAAPYGTMARINGMALRMVTGELAAERALETALYEAVAGWTDLKCDNMFPRCSKANAAAIVMDTILQPLRKSKTSSRL